MISPRVFTGGDLATNGYLLEGKEGVICFDAPEGMARELMRNEIKPVALLLTHGHFDHMWDSVLIQEDYHCPIYVHPADAPMVLDTSYVKMFGVVPPIRAPSHVETFDLPDQGSAKFKCAGEEFELFHIPGHSPGSVVFYHPGWGVLISGDTLFCGGVGRWDLPGGSRAALLQGLRKHLVHLPPETRVYAGHGPRTTIGHERETNPYLDIV
jgi:glyoxylase-like metal-dependent hydrolase (beta-lactamase superfamily II)